MGSKRQRNRRDEQVHRTAELWPKIWKSIGALAAAALTLWGAVFTYKTTGAQELRTQLYQPLFTDLAITKNATESLSSEAPSPKTLPELQRTGVFERAPQHLREEFVRIADSAASLRAAVLAVRDIVIREASAQLMAIRSQELDREWHARAVARLQIPGKGISDSSTQTFRHEARGRAVDPQNPSTIVAVGGPAFVVRDWVTYPESLSLIEELWTDDDYLYFNDRLDGWYWQLTREDLRRVRRSLRDELDPIHQRLQTDANFMRLVNERPQLLKDITAMEDVLRERIRDPTLMRDLLP
jgi:hypothetical protein